MPVAEQTRKVQATVRLPRPLYQQAKSFVGDKTSTLESINDLFVAAITAYVKLLRRKRIDAAFCGMAEDPSYQKEALLIAEQFSQSDWEAFELAEKETVEV
jgi:hypothetical protein